MTPRRQRLLVEDVHTSIMKIERYTFGMTLEEFRMNDLVVDAVIRNLEIIGEAAGKISDIIKEQHPDIPWRRMSALRNIAIHEYFGVDLDIVWNVAMRDVPGIKSRILDVLASLDSEATDQSGS